MILVLTCVLGGITILVLTCCFRRNLDTCFDVLF
jgi:hypothetical protein